MFNAPLRITDRADMQFIRLGLTPLISRNGSPDSYFLLFALRQLLYAVGDRGLSGLLECILHSRFRLTQPNVLGTINDLSCSRL